MNNSKCINSREARNNFGTPHRVIYIYMFGSTGSRIDSNLVNYVFKSGLNRKFSLVLLPPAIFELRRQYNYLKNISTKYAYSYSSYKLKNDINLEKLIDTYEKLSNNSSDKESQHKTMNYWRLIQMKFTGIDVAAKIATDPNPKSIIDKSHKKLVDLFQENIITNINDVDVFSNQINNIRPDTNTFNNCYDQLTRMRGLQFYENNIFDAEHAALSYNINETILDEDVLSIYSGSSIPSIVFEKNLKIEKEGIPDDFRSIRCPYCLMARLFCDNELKNTVISRTQFLNGSNELLNILGNGPETTDQLQIILERDFKDRDLNEIYDEMYDILCFVSMFAHGEFKEFFNEGFRNKYTDNIKNEFYKYLKELSRPINASQAKRRSFEEVLEVANIDQLGISNFVDQIQNKTFFDNLSSAIEKINTNSLEIYRIYYNYLEGYNYDQFSEFTKNYYVKILEPPAEEIKIID